LRQQLLDRPGVILRFAHLSGEADMQKKAGMAGLYSFKEYRKR
jgi:hypothetical protein